MGWVSGNPATDPTANAELVRYRPGWGVQVSVQILITFRGLAGFDCIFEHLDGTDAVVASHLLPIGLNPFILPFVGPINLAKDHSLRIKNRNQVTGEAQCSFFVKEGSP